MATLNGPNASYSSNGWFIKNDFWDTSALNSGYTLTGSYANASNLTTGINFSWNFGPIPSNGVYNVHAFPEIGFGQDPWSTATAPNELPYPLSIANLSKYLVNYNASWGGQGAGYNVAFEMYLTSKPQGGASTLTHEVMVWIHNGGWHPGGSPVGTFSDANYSGQIYSYPVHESGLNFNYTAFLTTADDPSGTIDLKAIMAKLKSLGIITGNEYISNLQLGAEIAAGTGSLTVNNMQIDVQAVGGTEQLIDGTGAHAVTGSPPPPPPPPPPPTPLPTTLNPDFNKDGKSDVIFQNSDGNARISMLSGATVLSTTAIGNPGVNVHAVATADFNGDGNSDILWWDTSGQGSIWLMNGTSVTSYGIAGPNPGSAWHAITAGDFNGDGKADILWQNTSTGQAMISLMNGLTVTSNVTLTTNPGTAWHEVATGDFNGDGKADILWQNTNGSAQVWLMNGTTMTSTVQLGNPGANVHAVDTGDFNGDGKSDILWWDTSGQASIWLMNGTSVTSYGIAGPNPGSNWHAIGAADYSGDGKSDIFWQDPTTGAAMVSVMNGLTQVSRTNLSATPGSTWHAVT